MSIQGIGSSNPASYSPTTSTGTGTSGSASGSATDSAVQNFLDYMKESPAERMVDQWLKEHGLSKQALAAMSPAKQAAIMKEMAKDIADEIKEKAAAKKTGITTDVSA